MSKNRDQRVYFLSEIAYDAHFFNADAYENLVRFLEQDPDDIMLVIDGALTRLDRPEILNSLLTYWEKSEKECRKASDLVPNYEQSQRMLSVQMEILDKHLANLHERLPEAKIVLCVDNDDTQYTVSRILLDLLVHRRAQINMAIKEMVKEKRGLAAEYKELRKEYRTKKFVSGKRKAKRRMIKKQRRALKQMEAEIVASKQELTLYRAQKIRPTHQFVTAAFVKHLMEMYKEICIKHGVEFMDRPQVLRFGESESDLTVKYAHSGHKTWMPVLHRDHSLVRSVLANQNKYNNLIKQIASEAETQQFNVCVESGHHGIGFATLQKIKDHLQETNFKGNSAYDPVIAGLKDYVKICLAIPFEDQELIARFMENKEPVRMSLGKPGGTRSHEVFRRFHNGSVSGLFMLTKSVSDGLLWTRYIQYQDFKDGSVLNQPSRYFAAWVTSDEHLGSPEENPMVRDGLFALYKAHADNPFNFYGRPTELASFISGGDTAEATLIRWDRRYDDRRDPQELLQENIGKLANLDQENKEEILELAAKMVSDTMSGYPGSMRVMMERVARYYQQFLDITLSVSKSKWAHLSVPGNHADGALRQTGLRETDFFVRDVKAQGVGVYEVGLSDHYRADTMQGARVGLGGYGDARIIHIEDYGHGVDGEKLFGPISLLIQHDPEGPGTSGLVGAAEKVGADVALAGHVHENWVKLFRIGLNQFRVAYRLSTVQGVTMTEKKYASSPPRTQAAHCIIMPKPGDFAEKALPAAYLREVGVQYNLQKVEEEIAKQER